MNTGIRLEILKEEVCSDRPGHRWYGSIKIKLKETLLGDRGSG
jgi:hypothetical protein